MHYLVTIACSVGLLLVGSTMHALWPNWRWYHEPLHASIEAVGGLAAIAMAAVLFHRPQRDAVTGKYRPLTAGFLGMGILEEFHAAVTPGNAFVLFRNLASLVGGIGFVSILSARNRGAAFPRRRQLWIIAIGVASLGIWLLAVPDQIPHMMRNGTFTPVAVAPQSVACLCFLAAGARFLSDYRRSRQAEDGLFATLALLFGLAEFEFMNSIPWDNRWWFWHTLRLAACLLTLGYISRSYFQVTADLEAALVQTIEAKETLGRSEERLREMLDDRARMARDLHDSTIQSLFATRLSLERCQRLISTGYQDVAAQLGIAGAALKTVIRDLRGYVLGLEPSHPVGPEFEAALVSLVEDMNRIPHRRFDIRMEAGLADLLTQEQVSQLLPIVREAMSNSLRHSAAGTGLLSLELKDEVVRLIVKDDGCRFEAATIHEAGRGLNNMEIRATMLGGRLEISSCLGGGTKVECSFPLRRTGQEQKHVAN